ncbi:MAG TPA: hypothetical protein VGS79_16650 [Puia sp.]|nr:hypothetical protein [Puia sp.]
MTQFSQRGLIPPAEKMHYTLRFASAMCFIGHGAFGIITKPIWCNYFAVFGISHDVAYRLMPLVGTVDILMGISLLFYPLRAVAAWLVCWGLITASLRPLSGESAGELIERAGNFGTPLALLLLSVPAARGLRVTNGWRLPAANSRRFWWSGIDAHPGPDTRTMNRVTRCLRIVVFLLLVGHGWLNLAEKNGLLQQYSLLGFSKPANVARLAGSFELLAALTVLLRPMRPLILAFFIWKMTTELFYPHWELFEWIERGGSYGSLLALWLALGKSPMSITRISQPATAF